MNTSHTLRRTVVALMLLVAFLVQGTWALAGTTGGLSGRITDAAGAPVIGAAITVTAPSQQSTTYSDPSGQYNFLALAPDTYTVSVAKSGYQPVSVAGVNVFADNNSSFNFRLVQQLAEIGHVSSRAAGQLVSSGITADTYSVDSAAIAKSAALGGGGNLDNAYSAIASVPGVTVPIGGNGWNQPVYIRGSQSFFSGYEYDGIPVNRAFDNYNSSTESNLGLQELQVYTGGGPSSNSSSGTAGFINQVIKTGTYPGSASVSLTLGTPQYDHSSRIEAGGASPNRNFSYYLGIGGYNQEFRYLDQTNSAGLSLPSGEYGYAGAFSTNANLRHTNGHGVLPFCNADGSAPASVQSLPWYAAEGRGSCLISNPAAALFGAESGISDREDIANFHFKIDRKSGLKDDIQLLASSSALVTTFLSSTNDGGGPGPYTLSVTGAPYCGSNGLDAHGAPCAAPNFPFYQDAIVYDLPFGAPIAGKAPIRYNQPSSPSNRGFQSEIPATARDSIDNDTGVFKIQYTHPFSDHAYVRAFGYSFFSDWTQAGAQTSYNSYLYGIGGPIVPVMAANYDLITHTAGGEIQFADQITANHLVTLTGNYTKASVVRFNNSGFAFLGPGTGSPIGYISSSSAGFQCWDPANPNAAIPCFPGGAYQSDAITGPTGTAPPGSAAANAGAQWVSMWNGAASGSLNHVSPEFGLVSLTDQWHVNDHLLLDLGIRAENYKYNLENSNTPQTAFYGSLISQFVCQNSVGTVDTVPLRPGQSPPAPINYESTCPAGYSHPHFSIASPASYTITDLAPRLSFTYTQSPDTVWRGSIGRYTEPPISASVQYLNSSGNNLRVWGATLPLGFNSPFHPIPEMSATQADISFEHHVKGTDISYKISPFFNYTNGYQEQAFIGPNFVTQAPVGAFRSKGVEFALNKGDFRRNGLSGTASLTYTDAKVQYQDQYYGKNQIRVANTTIAAFNKLTAGGGGSPCYKQSTDPSNAAAGVGDPVPCSYAAVIPVAGVPTTFGAITNPYYGIAAQPLLDESGWYAPGNTGLDPGSAPSTTYFDSPWVGALILNYRHDRFTFTPSLQIAEGSSYGGPMDIAGLDPRTCGHNISQAPGNIAAADPGADPNQCDYLALTASQAGGAAPQLFIPNPQNGNTFAKPGQFRAPWLLLANLAMSYELSPKATVNLTFANLFHNCFGGTSAPWTAAYAPGRNACGYGPVGSNYISNYYNGTSPNDTKANGVTPYPWQLQSYLPQPFNGAAGLPSPFNAYLSLSLKI